MLYFVIYYDVHQHLRVYWYVVCKGRHAPACRLHNIQYLNGRGRGDMYVKCEVEIPKKLNKTQREALKKFEGTLKEENYEKRKGFFKKLKDMFNN